MTPANTEPRPKYACTECGSTKVRGDFDTTALSHPHHPRIINLRQRPDSGLRRNDG